MTISNFRGDYRWLSNFHLIDVEFEGMVFPSTEHAYQAAKTCYLAERESIQRASTPGKARKLGQKVMLRFGWDIIKRGIMLDLTRQKFRDPELREKLLATGQHHLIENAPWGDR